MAGGSCDSPPRANAPIIASYDEYTHRICDIQARTLGRALPAVHRHGNQSKVNDGSSYGWDNNVLARAVTDEAAGVDVRIKS
jgi:hypothetical protein